MDDIKYHICQFIKEKEKEIQNDIIRCEKQRYSRYLVYSAQGQYITNLEWTLFSIPEYLILFFNE